MKANKHRLNGKKDKLERSYAKAFADYLLMGTEDALHSGYEIGRAALAEGRSILDIADMHHGNIARAVAHMDPQSFARDLDRARQFFGESLSPYEMAYRGFYDATTALRRLNETLEREIQRIAHGVHDEAGQLLFAARLAMDGLAHELDPALRARLQEIGSILDEVENQLRRLSHELRPTVLDDLGLVPALEFLTGRISKSTNLSIQIVNGLKHRCSPTIEAVVYRVVQEACTNITKHAHAKNVRIQLEKVARKLTCLVHDDGVGFEVSAALSPAGHRGLGLIGMRERLIAVGGTLDINSSSGRGTDLLVKIPWRSR
jgi:two-component system, NarL family, sensor histidine kinase UhpB